jgi:hypothetical protein
MLIFMGYGEITERLVKFEGGEEELVPAKTQRRKDVERRSIFTSFFAPLRLCGNPIRFMDTHLSSN